MKLTAVDFGLKFEMFIDNPVPKFADTMKMFNAAVMIVAPHGAGLSNMMFSEPGTFVVEGVCNIPHVNLCFIRLAHVLGHRWHGVTSRRGCPSVVDVSAASVDAAVRELLKVWKTENKL
jgi:capsular polysaccharide biosynthesis protein